MNKSNLELDLLKAESIIKKCCSSKVYSQNLYAALCNNRFIKNDEEWSCSWRVAGGIVADLRNLDEDYISFYCSGIGEDYNKGYVRESFVTSEIRNDLLSLGWVVKPYDDIDIWGNIDALSK